LNASSGAAGAMIGLLFVAVSLRFDLVFGPNAPAGHGPSPEAASPDS
jgi:hypothetical protein